MPVAAEWENSEVKTKYEKRAPIPKVSLSTKAVSTEYENKFLYWYFALVIA